MESARCRAFLAAAEHGSFSAAAEALHYTPSGVSQLVTALEQELELTLLRRTRRGVTLTQAGEKILPAARALLQQEDRIRQLAAEINGLQLGSITVGTYPSMAMLYLPEVLRAFSRDFPQIRVQVREGEQREIVEWLRTGEADVGFLGGGERLPGDWLPLAEDPMLAMLPRTHPLAEAEVFPLEAVRGEPFIMGGQGWDSDAIDMLHAHGIEPNVVLSTVSGISVLAMVESGLGMSIMNRLVTRVQSADIAMLPLDPPQHITLGMLLPSLDDAPPAVNKFVQYAVRLLTQAE
ncbi:MAG: LysR family transcriptional regulator [Oscillospiraceae bacterium]|nr:LysR family transcriptional regulator [Oscillospiraceae bacterium]